MAWNQPWRSIYTMLLFSHPVMSDSLQPHGLQHTRPPCLSSFPKVCPSSCPFHWWCHPDISSTDALFSFCLCLFQHRILVQWVSCSYQMAKILEFHLQRKSFQWVFSCFPSRLTGLISLTSKGLSGVFSSTTVQRYQFFGAPPALLYSSHNCTWPLGRP